MKQFKPLLMTVLTIVAVVFVIFKVLPVKVRGLIVGG
jgi:hypothetical protein